jgi:hypothetical protein
MSQPARRLPRRISHWSARREDLQHPRHHRVTARAAGTGIRTALRALGLPGAVIVADVNPLSPAVHMADRAYRVPMSSDPAYLDEIQEISAA